MAPNPRTWALAAALAALAAPAGAVRPLTPPAPEFASGLAWINAEPLSLKLMRKRKAVVVAFLNPTDLHALRLLPALKAWFDRYALSQLMVIGVMTPDLEASRDAIWVKAQVKRLGLDFPVVLDSDRSVWKAYANDGWPALYLIDRRGRIVFDHLGEGGYGEFEDEIRGALADIVGEAKLPSRASPPEPRAKDCGRATRDIEAGDRARQPPLALGENYALRPAILVEAREGELAAFGRWDAGPDGMILAQANKDRKAFVRVVFRASQALAALSPPAGRTARFFVKMDDQWLHEGTAGRDVRFDEDGRSFVPAGEARLYDLARDAGDRLRELSLIPDQKGAVIHRLSFADACLISPPP